MSQDALKIRHYNLITRCLEGELLLTMLALHEY